MLDRATFANGKVVTGSARDVLDYIAWIEHVCWIESLCDTVATALAVFNTFKRSASVDRGRAVVVA